jgi:2-aminoadipate transaminase
MPAPETYPLADLEHYAQLVLEEEGVAACSYWSFPGGRDEMELGHLGLRHEIAAFLNQREGREMDPRGVILTSGSSQGLSLVARAFLDPGDGAIVEESSFPYMVAYMRATKATLATVPIQEDGLDVNAVEARLQDFKARGIRPKIIYTISTFQVPTGTVMSLEKRKRLLELAEGYDVLIVEDNCYYELWFDAPPPPSLLSLDTHRRVLQSDSFSKMLAPGVRTGWVAGAPELIDCLAAVRQDLGLSQLMARILRAWLADGRLRPHLEQVRELYRRKRDVADAALQKYCASYVKYRRPGGGIYFWLEIDPRIDGPAVRQAVAAQGIACRPGEQMSSLADAKQFLRMSFLQVSEAELERGIAILGKAMAANLRSQPAVA